MAHRAYHPTLPAFPEFGTGDPAVDGLIPSARVKNWKRFESIISQPFFKDRENDFIFRGQRRYDWQLIPTLGRVSATASGAINPARAEEHLAEFRLAMRGKVSGLELADEDAELWAIGQHHGLHTHLLDWTRSPFIALYFAFYEPSPPNERPKSYSRTIFGLNKTKIEELDPEIVVQPRRNDHARLINQAGLFTQSPFEEETLETKLINLLAADGVNVDEPNELAQFIFKIHIPDSGREDCLRQLRQMNIHQGSIFPDPIGASGYCNELLQAKMSQGDVV